MPCSAAAATARRQPSLAAVDLAAEIGVEQEVRQLGVAVERFLDLAQERAADDAAAAPHQGHAALVDLPLRLAPHGIHEGESLGVGDDLAGVEGVLDGVDVGLLVELRPVSVGPLSILDGGDALVLLGRQAAGEDGLGDQGQGHAQVARPR